MNNSIGIIIALLVVVAGGWYYTQTQEVEKPTDQQVVEQVNDVMEKKVITEEVMEEKEDSMSDQHSDTEVMMEKDEPKDSEEVMEKLDEKTLKEVSQETAPASPGSFKSYSASAVSGASGDVVIGFFADWCPSCRVLRSDINASLGDIPAGLTILDADYDTESDLKKKYGVTYQHTLVQVDKNGNLIKKWGGGSTLESVVAQVN